MVGSGDMSFPPTIPDFTGTDVSFWVEDPEMDGGGFMDTLKGTYNKVRDYIGSSKLAQEVVKKGIRPDALGVQHEVGHAVPQTIDYAGTSASSGIPRPIAGTGESLEGQQLSGQVTAAAEVTHRSILAKWLPN